MFAARGKKPKVWMNVTTSANWHRPAVGIIRVEQEICRELSASYDADEFGLCIFEDNEFVPYQGASRLPKRTESQPLLWPDRSRLVPRSSTFDPVSGRVRRGRNPAGEEITRPGDAGAELPVYSTPRISYGDIIVSVGLDWDYAYVDAFQTLKNDMGVKIVTCCYDLIPIILPQYCVGRVTKTFRDYFTKISWSSSVILCISEKSRDDYRDFVKSIGAPEAETTVIPLGDNVPTGMNSLSSADVEISASVSKVAAEPFILFVSTIERRKNHEVLYRAYHLLVREGHAAKLPKLLFVGMTGWGVGDLLKDIELDPLTKDLIVQLNHVTDDELSYLYEKAAFCVYPSLYEGWGLPVGEALANGKAVVASGAASIPEVGGDLVTYLDPWNPRAWADEVLKLVAEPERLRAMTEAVRTRYTARTWRDTARVVRSALEKLRQPRDVVVTLHPGYDLYSMVGTPRAQAICSTGVAGLLTHGPYRALPAGTYDLAVAVDKLDGATGVMRCTVRSDQSKREHATTEVTFSSDACFGFIVSLAGIQFHSPVSDYEIYIEVSENLLVVINSIEIRQICS
jgi:glycosyltransferase involved in cell wall biosynthesis